MNPLHERAPEAVASNRGAEKTILAGLQSKCSTESNHATIELTIHVSRINGSGICLFDLAAETRPDGTIHLPEIEIPGMVLQ